MMMVIMVMLGHALAARIRIAHFSDRHPTASSMSFSFFPATRSEIRLMRPGIARYAQRSLRERRTSIRQERTLQTKRVPNSVSTPASATQQSFQHEHR
jgi:hypothetical protein